MTAAIPVSQVEIINVSHYYGQRCALDNVSLALQPGRFNALLGPNGAGKSTLFALLTRLYSLQTGDIRLNGLSIRKQPRALLAQLGVVFQQSTLDLDLTVLQNLEYHGALHGLSTREVRHRAARELEWLELSDREHDRLRTLNGGHRRRVEIARALLHQPKLLLLDEASAGLDIASRRAINQCVRALCQQRQLTVLWATHLLEEIAPSDPVAILHKGQVLEQDTGANICTNQQAATLSEAFNRLTGLQEAES